MESLLKGNWEIERGSNLVESAMIIRIVRIRIRCFMDKDSPDLSRLEVSDTVCFPCRGQMVLGFIGWAH